MKFTMKLLVLIFGVLMLVNAANAESPREPVADNTTQKEAYFLQAGAFSNADDADELKSRLKLLGMEASVQASTIPDKGVWHRVRLGPYKSADEMNEASAVLKQNGVYATPIGAIIAKDMDVTTKAKYGQSPREQLKQMVEQLQKSPADNALRENIIKLAQGLKPAPAIPEEARRAFVRGNTAFSEAKGPDDYARAVQRYEEALVIAPWWGDPYFNLAKALELRQEYSRAIQSLKLFVLTGPSADDARKAQDYSYALEDKQEKLTKEKSQKEAAARAEGQKKRDYQNKIGFLEGQWNYHVDSTAPNGTPVSNDGKIIIAVSGKMITFTEKGGHKPFVKGTMEAEDYTSIKWMAADDSEDKDSEGKVWSPAQDIPINISVDKARSYIHWEQPQILLDYQTGPRWTTRFGNNKFTLTR